MKKKSTAKGTKVTYHRFSVVDTRKPMAKSVASVDAASPELTSLVQKKNLDLKRYSGKVVFKKAVPRSTKLDGSTSSKRLVVKNGQVIGAQG
jgi:hypothetical protein